jgi:hypothetical protein
MAKEVGIYNPSLSHLMYCLIGSFLKTLAYSTTTIGVHGEWLLNRSTRFTVRGALLASIIYTRVY